MLLYLPLEDLVKANCPLVGPGHVGRVPSVGVFRDPIPYLCEF